MGEGFNLRLCWVGASGSSHSAMRAAELLAGTAWSGTLLATIPILGTGRGLAFLSTTIRNPLSTSSWNLGGV